MRKNKFMRLASLLLVLTLISTCAISGTYAKYVTTGSGMDTARVAKWGVSVTAAGTMFATEYAKDDEVFTETNSVISTEKVVAPGTKGDMAAIALAGVPEVASRVTYVADVDFSENWTVDGTVYCPIIVTINGQAYSYDGLLCTSIADYEQKLEKVISTYSRDYAAGTDLSTKSAENLAISWEWPFHVDDDTDAKDTWLGNQAAAGNPATLTVNVTCTVTQID